jgi:hypothetical protein
MKISFVWDSDRITPDEKHRIKENIKAELPLTFDWFADVVDDVVVSLYADILLTSLKGAVETTGGKLLCEVNYSLRDHTRGYSLPKVS